MTCRKPGSKGFTLYEVLVVVAAVALLAAISVPLMAVTMARARSTGAVEALAGAIKEARMRAIAKGWNYQVVAFDATGPVPNAFRIEGRNPALPGPPPFPPTGTATTPPFDGGAQANDVYTVLSQEGFGAAQIVPTGGATFTVTFDNLGRAVACVPASCQVQVDGAGRAATLTVSAAGAVRISK